MEMKTATTRMMKTREAVSLETPRTITSGDAKSQAMRYTTPTL
jgi:hypothetical protein